MKRNVFVEAGEINLLRLFLEITKQSHSNKLNTKPKYKEMSKLAKYNFTYSMHYGAAEG